MASENIQACGAGVRHARREVCGVGESAAGTGDGEVLRTGVGRGGRRAGRKRALGQVEIAAKNAGHFSRNDGR